MTARDPRWEVAQTDAGWHVRYRSSNGAILVTSEVYARKVGAENAIEVIAGAFINRRTDGAEIPWPANRETQLAEVRYVDERGEAGA